MPFTGFKFSSQTIKNSYIKGKNRTIQASNSIMDMKNIKAELISKAVGLLRNLISQESQEGDIFHNFKISDNKLIVSSAAYFVGGSYKFLQESHNNKEFISKNEFNRERIFADYANKIYSTTMPDGLVELFKQQQNKGVLVPVHAIFKEDKTRSIILTIRGTSSLKDAIIDGLATTETVYLQNEKYYVHSGFLRASAYIAEKRFELINKLLKENPGYELVVTGHSLGGAASTVTGVLLFDKYFNRQTPVNICGFASGTSFAAQENGKPLEQYLKENNKLKIKTFIYENDIVPRLSAFEMFVFLSTVVTVCKVIFLNQKISLFKDLNFSSDLRVSFLKDNRITRNAINASKLIGKVGRKASNITNTSKEKIKNRIKSARKLKMWGGTSESTENVLKIIVGIYKKLYSHFENKFRQNGDFFKLYTSHPGTIYQLTDKTIIEIDPYSLSAKFRIESLLNHLMNNYIKSLKVNGGSKNKTKKTKRGKKTKRKKKRRKHKTMRR